MTYDAYAIRDSKTVVFWSRKSGNTSLAEWFWTGFSAPHADASTGHSRRRIKNEGGMLVETDEAVRLVREEGYEDYVLARNPFKRAVSVYVEKFVYYEHRALDDPEKLKGFAARTVNAALAQRFPEQAANAASAPYQGISFVTYLEFVKAKILGGKARGKSGLNRHLDTQVPYALEGDFAYKHIIRLERVSEQIQPLAERLGLKTPFPHSRSNEPPAKLVNDTDLSDVPSAEMIRSGVVPGAGALLNERTKALIRDAYGIDFRMLGYDVEMPL